MLKFSKTISWKLQVVTGKVKSVLIFKTIVYIYCRKLQTVRFFAKGCIRIKSSSVRPACLQAQSELKVVIPSGA
jgi:hypothetical protein